MGIWHMTENQSNGNVAQFALRKSLGRAVLPLKFLTDNAGCCTRISHRRSALHSGSNPHGDEWAMKHQT